MHNYIVKSLTPEDAKTVAEIHNVAFQNFFLTSLGKPFLVQFYKSILRDSDGIGVGIYNENQMIGFAIGTRNAKSFYKRLAKKNFFKLTLPAVFSFLKKPVLLLRLVRSFSAAGKHDSLPNSATLLSICVRSDLQNAGAGKLLLTAFENKCMELKKSFIELTTDADNNASVNSFYSKNNFNLISQFRQSSTRTMNLYRKKI